MLTGRSFAELIDANRELLALGTANVGADGSRAFRSAAAAAVPRWPTRWAVAPQLYALAMVIADLLAAGPLLAGFPVGALNFRRRALAAVDGRERRLSTRAHPGGRVRDGLFVVRLRAGA